MSFENFMSNLKEGMEKIDAHALQREQYMESFNPFTTQFLYCKYAASSLNSKFFGDINNMDETAAFLHLISGINPEGEVEQCFTVDNGVHKHSRVIAYKGSTYRMNIQVTKKHTQTEYSRDDKLIQRHSIHNTDGISYKDVRIDTTVIRSLVMLVKVLNLPSGIRTNLTEHVSEEKYGSVWMTLQSLSVAFKVMHEIYKNRITDVKYLEDANEIPSYVDDVMKLVRSLISTPYGDGRVHFVTPCTFIEGRGFKNLSIVFYYMDATYEENLEYKTVEIPLVEDFEFIY